MNNPTHMFSRSNIQTFTSIGIVLLFGNSEFMFNEAKSFDSDLSKWNVEKVTDMAAMFYKATTFNSDLSR